MTDKEKLEKLKKLADAMYYAAKYLTADASRLHKAMDEYHQFIIHECKEEPVSNPIDFEKELYKAFGQVKDFTLGMRIAKWFYDKGKNSQEPVSEELEEAAMQYAKLKHKDAALQKIVSWDFRAGAKWQEEQFEKNRLKHCNSITNEQAELESDFIDQHLDKYQRMPTFLDAIEYGMEKMKEQMMSKAVDGKIYETQARSKLKAATTGKLSRLDYKVGDKVRVIVIKED